MRAPVVHSGPISFVLSPLWSGWVQDSQGILGYTPNRGLEQHSSRKSSSHCGNDVKVGSDTFLLELNSIGTYTCIHWTRTHARMHACLHAHTCVCACAHAHAHTHTHAHTRAQNARATCTFTCTHVYTCTHTHPPSNTRTHACILNPLHPTQLPLLPDVEEGGETAFPDSNSWAHEELPKRLGPFSSCTEGGVAFKPKLVSRTRCMLWRQRSSLGWGGVDWIFKWGRRCVQAQTGEPGAPRHRLRESSRG